MKVLKNVLILAACFTLLFCTACSDKQSASENADQEKTAKEQTEEVKPIQLNNTYVTKYGDVNAVTYPKFSFDYPDNWKVSAEEVSATSEKVVLSNDRGATVTYSYIGGVAEGQLGGASAVTMARVDVSKAGDSQFIPGYVQATDYSGLGKFMVAKLKVTGQMDMKNDSDFQDVDGKVSYGVLPESWIGTKDDVRRTFEADFAFWYSGYISVIAISPDESFTPEEEKEVLAILGSFRTE